MSLHARRGRVLHQGMCCPCPYSWGAGVLGGTFLLDEGRRRCCNCFSCCLLAQQSGQVKSSQIVSLLPFGFLCSLSQCVAGPRATEKVFLGPTRYLVQPPVNKALSHLVVLVHAEPTDTMPATDRCLPCLHLRSHLAFFPVVLSGQALSCAESPASVAQSLHPGT